ncbi:MAG TPA: hypothetical protein VFS09_11225 [Candidatus Eisenbacteria bacterium]|nr:hypothetical protein [Candidatus Eisenbacteria bacterium]
MRRYVRFAPSLVAVLLSLPGFGYPYLFDDFDFLGRVQGFHLGTLLPDPQILFWRPLSREIYFGLLYSLGSHGPLVGHVLNALLLAAAVFLLVEVGATLGGRKTGLAAGFAFAAFAQSPLLVAWLSGAQDLLAIVLLLAAIRLRLARRFAASAAAFALALLSKETAFALVPLLALLDWLRREAPYRVALGWMLYGGIGLVWAALHPGIHALVAGGLANTPGGYVGLENPHRMESIVKSLVTLANLPISGLATPIAGAPWGLVAAALAIVVAAWVGWRVHGERASAAAPTPLPAVAPSRDSTIPVGAALALLPLALTVAVVRGWSPYYMVIPFLGVALLLGRAASSLAPRAAVALLVAFVVLGGWTRNLIADPGLPTLRNLKPAAEALAKVEAGFESLHPTMPRGARLLVSVQSAGAASVYVHLYHYQSLRIWYRDATLVTRRPDVPIERERPHLLFWVDPRFGVHEIDLESFAARPAGDAEEFQEYKKTLRYYARGLAAGGDDMKAALILARIPEEDPVIRGIDVRTAAMFFLYRGRSREARMLLERVPDLPEAVRLAGMGAVLVSAPPEIHLDDDAFTAFELDPGDERIVLALGRRFAADGRRDLAARFGTRLLAIDPKNAEAQGWIDDLKNLPATSKIAQPIGEDVGMPYR